MSDVAKKKWANRRYREETLPSGTVVGYELPDVTDMILSGVFPTDVLSVARQWESGTIEEDKELTDAELGDWRQFRAHLIARMVVKVDGEETKLTPEEAAELPRDDASILMMRSRLGPKAPEFQTK